MSTQTETNTDIVLLDIIRDSEWETRRARRHSFGGNSRSYPTRKFARKALRDIRANADGEIIADDAEFRRRLKEWLFD